MAESSDERASASESQPDDDARNRTKDPIGILAIKAPARLNGLRLALPAPQVVLGGEGDVRLDFP